MGAWIEQGACIAAAPELFFPVSPVGRTRTTRRQIDTARAVCHQCPVIESCRSWTAANPQLTEYGVWAGTTEEERRAPRRRANRAAQRAATQVEQQPETPGRQYHQIFDELLTDTDVSAAPELNQDREART